MKTALSFTIAMVFTTLAVGEAAAQAGSADGPPPAPAPGSSAIFRSGADLMGALERSLEDGDRSMAGSSIVVTDQYRGSIVHRKEPHGPIAHAGNTEIHYILEGSGTVETGGTIIRQDDAPARLEGGVSQPVVVGDLIIIPAGSPHRYSQLDEPITYLEWRFVAPE